MAEKTKLFPGEAGLEPAFPVDKTGTPTVRRLREPFRHAEELVGRTEFNEPRYIRVDENGKIVLADIQELTDLLVVFRHIEELLIELVEINKEFRDGKPSFLG